MKSNALSFGAIALGMLLMGCCGLGQGGASSPIEGNLSKASLRDGLVNSVGGLRLFDDYTVSLTAAMGATRVGTGVFFDTNLYYSFSYSGNQTTISYFTDQTAKKPVGTIVLTPSLSYTVVEAYTAVVDVTGGSHPAKGTLTFANLSADRNTFTLQGQLTTPTGPNSTSPVIWSFNLNSSGWTKGTLTGSYSATEGSKSISFTNVLQSQSGNDTILSELAKFQPGLATRQLIFTIHDNNATAVVKLDDGTTAEIQNGAGGTITYPDGTSIPVTSFYSGV